MGFVKGRIHPPPLPGVAGELRGFYVEAEEQDEFMRQLKGKPVYIQHRSNMRVGKVMEVSVGRLKELTVTLYVDERRPLGAWALDMVKQGELSELSIGYETPTIFNGAVRMGPVVPNELSIVSEGAIAQSCIESFGTAQGGRFVTQSGVLKSCYGEQTAHKLLAMLHSPPPVEAAPLHSKAFEDMLAKYRNLQ